MPQGSTVIGCIVLGIMVAGGVSFLLNQPIELHRPLPEKTHLTVDRVEFRREVREITPRWLPGQRRRLPMSNEEMLTVYMFLSPEGRPPSWWFDKNRGNIVIGDFVISDEEGKQKKFPGFISEYGRTNDTEVPKHYAIVTCYVPKKSSLKGYNLSATIHMIGVKSVLFRVPVNNIGIQPLDMTVPITTPNIKILGKGFAVA